MRTQPALPPRLASDVRRDYLARLDERLTYHDAAHTLRRVLPMARRLARAEGLEPSAVRLLLTAALLHDLGFLERYENNEPLAARMARELLPRHGFTAREIESVATLILATDPAVRPRSRLARILRDADMENLGRPDCLDRGECLRLERAAFGSCVSRPDWLRLELRLLRSHRYFTAGARRLLDAGKRRNARKLEDLLASLRETPKPGPRPAARAPRKAW